VRLTPQTVEIFLRGERIAAHQRTSGNHRHTTRSFSGVPSKKLEQIQGGTKICQESSINEPKP